MFKISWKLFLIAVISFSQVSCRDVEKNPSGCGYDYTSDAEGNCVKKSIIAQRVFKKAEEEIFKNPFFMKYIVEDITDSNYQIEYQWNHANIELMMESEDLTKEVYEFIIVNKFLKSRLESYKAQLERINEDIYVDGIYKVISRVNGLIYLMSDNLFDVKYILGEYFYSMPDEKKEKNFLQRSALHKKLKALNGESIFSMTRRSDSRYDIDVPNHNGDRGTQILENTREAIMQSEGCIGDSSCLQVFSDQISEISRELYNQLYYRL